MTEKIDFLCLPKRFVPSELPNFSKFQYADLAIIEHGLDFVYNSGIEDGDYIFGGYDQAGVSNVRRYVDYSYKLLKAVRQELKKRDDEQKRLKEERIKFYKEYPYQEGSLSRDIRLTNKIVARLYEVENEQKDFD